MEKVYKHLTEGAVNMFLDRFQILQQTELDFFAKNSTLFDKANPCHIYFVLKRPRVTLIPDKTIIEKQDIYLFVKIHLGETSSEVKLHLSNPAQSIDLKVESKYPFNLIEFKLDGKPIIGYKLSVLVDEIHRNTTQYIDHLDYEVLYIGQAYGTDGNRTAIERLTSHSTLQGIYSEAMFNNPDSEIWIMLCNFNQASYAMMNGMVKTKEENSRRDSERFLNFIKMKFTEQQRINFTEAALIKYFEPPYNKIYKDSFPNPAHSSYSECYALEISAILVEVDISDVRRKLFSNKVPANYRHLGRFYLSSDEDRYKMFEVDWK